MFSGQKTVQHRAGAIADQLKFKSGEGRIHVRYFGDLGQRPRLQQIAAEGQPWLSL
jgi:hypothetical protein